MASAEFAGGMDELLVLTGGVEVLHILDERHCATHPLTSAARIMRGRLSYAASGTS